MWLRLAIVGGWIATACAIVVAADYWDEKDFTMWSSQEVDQMLNDSPWSRPVTVSVSSPPGASRRGIDADGGPGNTGGLRAVPDPESSRGRGPRGAFVPTQRLTLTVSWRSALPVKLALVRQRLGDRLDLPLPFEQWAFLVQMEPLYIVS